MNKKTIVLYESQSGLTEQYARWIGEDLNCQVIPLKDASDVLLNEFDIILFGSGLRAGRIRGLNKFQPLIVGLSGKNVTVFATGAGPAEAEYVEKIKKANFPEGSWTPQEFYYYQAGMIYEKLGFVGKFMKFISPIIARKKTDEPFTGSFDFSKREWIDPLVESVRRLVAG